MGEAVGWVERSDNPSSLSAESGMMGIASLHPSYEATNSTAASRRCRRTCTARSGSACRAPARRADWYDVAPALRARRRAVSRRAPALRELQRESWAPMPSAQPRAPSSPAGHRFWPRSGPGRIPSPARAASARAGPWKDPGQSARLHDTRPPARRSPDIRSPVQSAAAIAFFRTIQGLLKYNQKLKNSHHVGSRPDNSSHSRPQG